MYFDDTTHTTDQTLCTKTSRVSVIINTNTERTITNSLKKDFYRNNNIKSVSFGQRRNGKPNGYMISKDYYSDGVCELEQLQVYDNGCLVKGKTNAYFKNGKLRYV